ncbi:MAG: hypothetical protein LBU09_00965 [Endomicrobium sp.]|jgi:hypothetical protein|nr:hypothetical protein [Endomicrobium sp.]
MKLTVEIKEPLITQADLDAYEVEVGILPDTYDKKANKPKGKKAGFHIVAGGPARYRRKASKKSIGEVASYLDERYDWTGKAENNENNADLNEVVKCFCDLFGKDDEGLKRRYLNACRTLVRNPIVRKELGNNALSTIKQKGFDRSGIDTGKTINSIQARFVKNPTGQGGG